MAINWFTAWLILCIYNAEFPASVNRDSDDRKFSRVDSYDAIRKFFIESMLKSVQKALNQPDQDQQPGEYWVVCVVMLSDLKSVLSKWYGAIQL